MSEGIKAHAPGCKLFDEMRPLRSLDYDGSLKWLTGKHAAEVVQRSNLNS